MALCTRTRFWLNAPLDEARRKGALSKSSNEAIQPLSALFNEIVGQAILFPMTKNWGRRSIFRWRIVLAFPTASRLLRKSPRIPTEYLVTRKISSQRNSPSFDPTICMRNSPLALSAKRKNRQIVPLRKKIFPIVVTLETPSLSPSTAQTRVISTTLSL